MISFERLTHDQIRPGDVQDINLLLAQLSARRRTVDDARLALIALFSGLFVARDEEHRIKAMATLTVIHAPSGSAGWLEDIVVDEHYRGRHIAEDLILRVIQYAFNERQLKRLELTSKPERVAANHIYQKLGFKLRETNYYRMDL